MLDPKQLDLLDSITDAIVIVNDKGQVLFVNAPLREKFGFDKDELIGKSIEQLIPERFWDSHKLQRQTYLEQPRKRPMGESQKLFGRHKEGHEFPIRVSLSPQKVDGQWEIIGIIEDLTLRTQAEAQNRVRISALEAAANAIVITDSQGKITWANPAFTNLTGYSIDEVVGQSPRLLKSGYHDDNFYRMLWGKIGAGQTWQGKVINRRKNGEIYTEEMTITPVKGDEGEITHYIAVKQDVSEQVAREINHSKIVQG